MQPLSANPDAARPGNPTGRDLIPPSASHPEKLDGSSPR